MARVKLNDELLSSVISLVKQAGNMLLDFYQQDLVGKMKVDDTPVTEADIAVSKFLVSSLQQLTPSIPVLSEESCDIPFAERQAWQDYWLIDPLDGTQQFIDKTGQFSVLIALVRDNQPHLGIVHTPVADNTVYAVRGAGAWRENKGILKQLHPQHFKKEDPIRIVIGNTSNAEKVLAYLQPNILHIIQRCGSSGVKGVMVAQGESDVYIRIGKTGEWDTAALECILHEIGGEIYDLSGNSLTYNQRESLLNPDFVMSCTPKQEWESILILNK